MSCHFGTPVISFNTTFTKTNTPCENKQLHYRLGDLDFFPKGLWYNREDE